jgi:hypothetical protein
MSANELNPHVVPLHVLFPLVGTPLATARRSSAVEE